MKGENYRELSAYFQGTKARSNTIKALHDVLPLVMYIFYPIQLIVLAVNDGLASEKFLRFALIPLGTLIVISIVRAIINAKRPYEVYDYTPPVRATTKARAFRRVTRYARSSSRWRSCICKRVSASSCSSSPRRSA